MNKLALIFTATLAFISVNTFAAGDVAKGKAKSVTCTACHGVDGNSMVPNFPKLAGQGESYLFKQLKDFKSAERKDGLMAGIVAALSTDDMANLAAYFSKQSAAQGVASKTANIALGERLYRGGDKTRGVTACIACHGPVGKGNPAALYPLIYGQGAMYTAKQLNDYASGARKSLSPVQIMQDISKKLTDEEILAVSSYIQGLY